MASEMFFDLLFVVHILASWGQNYMLGVVLINALHEA